MNKKTFIAFSLVLGFFLTVSSLSEAQSTLEYSTLISSVSAAASKAKKEKGKDGARQEGQESSGIPGMVSDATQKVYGESSQLMSKSASILGQVGGGMQAAQAQTPQAPEITPAPQETQATEPETKETPATKTTPEEKTSEEKKEPLTKVYLKNGSVIEGNIVERKDDYIKIDTSGIPVTYFKEEIDRIEGPTL